MEDAVNRTMHLDPKALDAAINWHDRHVGDGMTETEESVLVGFLRSYLSASIPAEIGELVERSESSDPDKFTAWDRLRIHAATDDYDFFDTEHAAEILEWVNEAASLIQSQAARIAELEAGLLVARKWMPVGHRNGLTATENMERDAVDALLNGERKG